MIPLVDTFDDIKRCLGAVSVELPTAEDLETVEPSIIDKTVTEVPTIGSLEGAAHATSLRKVAQPLKEVPSVGGSEGAASVECLSIVSHPGKVIIAIKD